MGNKLSNFGYNFLKIREYINKLEQTTYNKDIDEYFRFIFDLKRIENHIKQKTIEKSVEFLVEVIKELELYDNGDHSNISFFQVEIKYDELKGEEFRDSEAIGVHTEITVKLFSLFGHIPKNRIERYRQQFPEYFNRKNDIAYVELEDDFFESNEVIRFRWKGKYEDLENKFNIEVDNNHLKEDFERIKREWLEFCFKMKPDETVSLTKLPKIKWYDHLGQLIIFMNEIRDELNEDEKDMKKFIIENFQCRDRDGQFVDINYSNLSTRWSQVIRK